MGFQSSQLRNVNNAAKQWTNWASVYNHLASEGRIWDFRDLFIAFKLAFGLREAVDAFFNTLSLDEVMDMLDSDWETVTYDLSTNIALLDILGSLILESNFENTSLQHYKTCLKHGEKLVQALINEHPETTKSRPFARWLVAKAVALSCDSHSNPFSDFQFLDQFPGLQIQQGNGVHIPIYVPLRSERPTWQVKEAPPEWKEAIQMALKIATKLGDYETQALCLKYLIIRSQEPRKLLRELSDLQNLIQDDQDSYLRTCLSKLLFITDLDSQRQLAEELFKFRQDKTIINQSLPHNLSLQWARSIILSTLPTTFSETTVMGESSSLSARLPKYIRDFTDVRKTFHTQSRPRDPFLASDAKLRQWPIDNTVDEEIQHGTRIVTDSEFLMRPRVQTLSNDTGNRRVSSYYKPERRYGHPIQHDTRQEVTKKNEETSKQPYSAQTVEKSQTGNQTDDSRALVLLSERPISQDMPRDTAVTIDIPETEITRREVSRGRATTKDDEPFQANGSNTATDNRVTIEEVPEDYEANPRRDI